MGKKMTQLVHFTIVLFCVFQLGSKSKLSFALAETTPQDPCVPDPCENGGTCDPGDGNHTCLCAPGWSGPNCTTDIDLCDPDPCANNGTCVPGEDFYTCNCAEGYTGTNCDHEINYCDPEPCENSGTCMNKPPSGFECQCPPQWSGSDTCSEDVDECKDDSLNQCSENADCVNTDGGYNCSCHDGFTGDGFTCTFQSPCDSDPCQNGYCSAGEAGAYQCLCHQGWTGDRCDEDIDECETGADTCAAEAEGGVCTNTNGSYTCSCAPGYSGDGHNCIEDLLYPFNNTKGFTGDTVIEGPYTATGGLAYFGQKYHNIYVSMDGYITLERKFEKSNPYDNTDTLPADQIMIAPYWSDIDTSREAGALYIDHYTNRDSSDMAMNVTERVVQDVKDYGGVDPFTPSFILVVTWNQVAPYPASTYANKENATFQLILSTDSKQSFVTYIYDREKMLWDAESDNRSIAIAHSAADNTTEELPVDNKYRPDLNSNIGHSGKYLYQLGPAIENNNLPCMDWYQDQNADSIQGNATDSEACPCTLDQAKMDSQFIPGGTDTCVQSRFVDRFNHHTKWICCYDDSGYLMTGLYSNSHMLYDGVDAMDTMSKCCVDAQLCHLFYEMRPSDDCSRYQPPTWGPAWGDPHLVTMDGNEYTFNGRGEYILLRIGDADSNGKFHLQGRTDLVKDMDGNDVNATVFTAFAAQATGDAPSSILETHLTDAKDDIQMYVDSEDAGLLSAITDTLTFNGVQLEKTDSGDLLAAFENGIGIKISQENGFLRVSVSAPSSYKSMAGSGGLFGSFDGDKEKDFVLRDGSTPTPENKDFTEEELFPFGQDWGLLEEESLFNYSLGGDANFSDFYFPDFRPTFYADMLHNLTAIPGLNETAAELICTDNRACLVDYIATQKEAVAMATKTQQEMFEKEYTTMKNQPPKFAQDTPTTISVAVGQEFTLTLSATDPEGQTVTMAIDTNIEEYTFENNITFQWTPSVNYTDPTMMSYVKFIAQDQDGAKAVYWPKILLCACSENAQCSHDYMEETEYDSNSDCYFYGKCDCNPGYMGDRCEAVKDECDPNPCYPGVECQTKDAAPGYDCGSCPENMEGDGERCTSPNECLDGTAKCEHMCENQRDGFKCSCRPGYELETNGYSCEDVDECTEGTHNCTGEGMYCLNNEGGFTCECKARYIYNAGQDKCVKAPKKFLGQLTFNIIELEDGRFVGWTEDLKDETSSLYTDVTNDLVKEVNDIYGANSSHLYVGAEIKSLTEGSIQSQYYLSYEESSPIDADSVGDILDAKLAGCTADGPDCNIGKLYGVNPDKSFAQVTDLCADDMSNDCDPVSTNCTSTQGGTFTCACKDGYRKFLDIDNICQDIDECTEEPGICDNKTSQCLNLPGSYQCECKFGYKPDPDQENTCLDVCDPNPCKHDGECVREENSFVCKCDGIWSGQICDEENDEAVKMRNIAIGVGAAVGALCLILIILLVIACLRAKKNKYSYSCRASDKYSTSGEVSLDMWEPTSRSHLRSSDKYEMTENNGTKHGASQGSGDARPQQHSAGGHANDAYVHA